MSRTEDLLRQALASTALDPQADVLHGLDARIRRARRRVAAIAGVAAAVVVAAVVVPLATVGSGPARGSQLTTNPSPSPSAPKPSPTAVAQNRPEVWLASGATDVATGDDGSGGEGVWALVGQPEQARVVGLDPATGAVMHRIAVPGPVNLVSVGLGYVWAYGGGDGAYGDLSVIDRIDPSTQKVDTLHIHGKGAPSSMAFTAQGAYVSLAVADKVVRVSGVTGPLALGVSVTVPGQPEQLTVVADGTAWVFESLAKKWAHLDLGDGRSRLVDTEQWSSQIFGLSHDGYLWTSDSASRVIELSPSTLSVGVSVSYGNRLPTPGPATAVVDQVGAGGIFVATADPSGASPSELTGLFYYSAHAVSAGAAPTARLAGVSAGGLAAMDDGGVVFVTGTGALERWKP